MNSLLRVVLVSKWSVLSDSTIAIYAEGITHAGVHGLVLAERQVRTSFCSPIGSETHA